MQVWDYSWKILDIKTIFEQSLCRYQKNSKQDGSIFFIPLSRAAPDIRFYSDTSQTEWSSTATAPYARCRPSSKSGPSSSSSGSSTSSNSWLAPWAPLAGACRDSLEHTHFTFYAILDFASKLDLRLNRWCRHILSGKHTGHLELRRLGENS